MVVVDIREPGNVIGLGLKYFPDLDIDFIEVGDVVERNCAIERKQVNDFASSVLDRRVFAQATNMKANYKHSFVILVGGYDKIQKNKYQKFSVNRFIGAQTDLLMLYGVPVLHVDSEDQFWRYCQSIFKKADGEPPKNVEKITGKKGDTAFAALSGIKGIGAKRAETILETFTLHDLCHATVKDLMKVDGVGKSRANTIKKVFYK